MARRDDGEYSLYLTEELPLKTTEGGQAPKSLPEWIGRESD